ncbi:hypothetical protein RQP46_002197 [Phenoliferia psychrophenolica]
MRVTQAIRLAKLSLARPTSTASPSAARLVPLAPSSTTPIRALSSSSSLAFPPRKAATTTSGGIGSGQGGKVEKEQRKRDKEAKLLAKAVRSVELEKEKLKAAKDKLAAVSVAAKSKAKAAKAKKAAAKIAAVKPKKPRSLLHPPKAVSNPWILYLSDYVSNLKAKLAPGEKLPAVTTLVVEAAPLYRNLSTEDRTALLVRFQAAKDAFPAQYEAWKATLTPQMIKEENVVRTQRRKLNLSSKRNLRIEGEPKRPLSPFFRFSLRERKNLEHLTLVEQSKEIAQLWRAIAPEDKKALEDEYAVEHVKYKEIKRVWEEENGLASPPAKDAPAPEE